MPKYAQFDLTVDPPSPVIGWYDTDHFNYRITFPAANMLQMTDEEWANRLTGSWAVDNDALVEYTPPTPVPSLPDQANILLQQKIADGIALSSTGTPSLNATYALDSVSTAQIFQIGLFANQFAVFPSGTTTQMYPDITGQPHSFSVAQFIAFLRVVAPLVSNLTSQAGVMAQGGDPDWPSQSATII